MTRRARQTDTSRPVPAADPSPLAQPAAQSVHALARAGQHAHAVEAATRALAQTPAQTLAKAPRDVAQQLQLLELRIDSLLALMELGQAMADVQVMLALAAHTKRAADRARALIALSLVHIRQEDLAKAARAAEEGLDAARRSRQPLLVATSLLRSAMALKAPQPDRAAADAQAAAMRFESLGTPALQGQALRVLAAVRLAQADTPEHRAIAERAP